MDEPNGGAEDLSWTNIALGLSFIAFNAVISQLLHLGVGTSLVTAAVRCVVQLSVMALVLQQIFSTNNPWAVAGLAGA
jgi:ABC-type iron transport system FetAB permease component